MDARTGRRQKRMSQMQEKRTAADLGGRTQAASGATRLGGGGDVRGSNKRIECKYTERGSYSLKYDELKKVREQAIKLLETPVLQFAFLRAGKMDLYAVVQWDTAGDWRDPYVLDTDAKSISLPQDYLRTCLLSEGQRVQIVFREGSIARLYEVVRWDDYLKRIANVGD